jgi:hypothetical protein
MMQAPRKTGVPGVFKVFSKHRLGQGDKGKNSNVYAAHGILSTDNLRF